MWGTAALALLLNLAGAVAGPADLRSGALATGVVAAVLLGCFWAMSAVLIGAGVKGMGIEPRREALLAVTGLTWPVLLTYPLLTFIQTVLATGGHGDASGLIGWLALPALIWFVALTVVAITSVYEMSAASAMALAFLPYAAMTAVLLILVLVVSGLHAGGVI